MGTSLKSGSTEVDLLLGCSGHRPIICLGPELIGVTLLQNLLGQAWTLGPLEHRVTRTSLELGSGLGHSWVWIPQGSV